MSININKKTAQELLIRAYSNPQESTDEIGKSITSVLRGTHKTYKYILFTALLAKATDGNVDILSIQAKDKSNGAYDARSLCHKVIVPFERKFIPHSLGDSNEPYLNKPARFERISLDNAVRDGRDYQTLKCLVETLPKIKTSTSAFRYLVSAIYTLKQIQKEYELKFTVNDIPESNDNTQAIFDYINRITEKACDGETCPLIVSCLEELCFPRQTVIAHNVNECGASSKEIGDIDIYKKTCPISKNRKADDSVLIAAIEVKDKNFSEQDVQHAILKFRTANLERSLFIYGKNAQFDSIKVHQIAARYGRIGTYCSVISIMDYARLRLFNTSHDITMSVFVECLLKFAKTINIKDETLNWLKESLLQ